MEIKKLCLLVLQLLLGALLVVVGLYNCTVSGIDPLWVSLIVLPVSIFLPHPHPPKLPSADDETDSGIDVPDGPTPESIRRYKEHRIRRIVFALHIIVCLTIASVGVCCLLILDSHWRSLWIALITFAVGCLVPTPLILLR